MSTFNFALDMLKRERKKNILYQCTLLFAIAIAFVFCGVMNNRFLIMDDRASGGGGFSQVSIPLSLGLPFIIICFCCFMMLYATNFFLIHKLKEFALLYTSGLSAGGITKYVLYQLLIILGVAVPLGFLIGIGGLFLVNTIIYNYLAIKESVFTIPPFTILNAVAVIFCMVIIICIVIHGFLFRNELQVLLNRSQKVNTVKIKVKRSTWFFSVFYVLGLLLMVTSEHSATIYIVPTCVGLIGINTLTKQGVPNLIRVWKRKKGITKKDQLIYFSYLSTALQSVSYLIISINIIITILFPILVTQSIDSNEYITGLISYGVIIVLLVICVVYKLNIDFQTRKKEFKILWNIGYTKPQLQALIKKELCLFYAFLIVIPMPYLITIGIRFLIHDTITIVFLGVYILVYILPVLVSIFGTYRSYVKTVVLPI